ncbi:MAG: hypothetical protein JNM56_23750 [Planctomycetia bacterium]|nr:hypothetical protein [Planctomycetia bacterium]
MTMTLLHHNFSANNSTPAQRLRLTTAAVRVSMRWLGVRKTLTPEQKNQAAEPFNAEGEYLSARKKLLDTTHPAYKEVTAVRGNVLKFWKSVTLPFPEPGVRLIKQDTIEAFDRQMRDFQQQLEEAVARLDDHYSELKAAARRRLGELYDANDYPPRLRGLFGIEWTYPSVEAPDYLLQLSPALYEQEKARVAARFQEAVQLAEQAFIAELGRLVSHLTERLTAGPDGEKKVFRDSMIANLTEFFEQFRQLNVHSNTELDDLVGRAQRIVQGIEPQALRDNSALRQHVAAQLATVQSTLDGMLIDQPRRRIVRSAHSNNGGPHAARD